MFSIRINYKRVCSFLGRNGLFMQSGIELGVNDGKIILTPLTSKKVAGRCFIDIPVEHAEEVGKALIDLARSK